MSNLKGTNLNKMRYHYINVGLSTQLTETIWTIPPFFLGHYFKVYECSKHDVIWESSTHFFKKRKDWVKEIETIKCLKFEQFLSTCMQKRLYIKSSWVGPMGLLRFTVIVILFQDIVHRQKAFYLSTIYGAVILGLMAHMH